MYADYNFYTSVFFGKKIAGEDFPALEERAGTAINFFTFGRAASADGDNLYAVKKAACAAAEKIQIYEQRSLDENGNALPGAKTSESVGGYSVSYAVTPAGSRDAMETHWSDLYATICLYLGHTGLLYRGMT